MANLGVLSVLLTAQTNQFNQMMAKATNQMNAFGGVTSKVSGLVRTIFAPVLGMVAVGGLVVYSRRALQTIDETAKLSDRINTTTENLVGLHHAAALSGVSAQMLNFSLEQMGRRLGSAKVEASELTPAMERLNLDIDKLAQMDSVEAFTEIAEAISKLESSTAQADAAYRIFGRSGMMMLNLIKSGRAGIEQARKEAEALGETFSRMDASRVEEANDAVTRFVGSLQGVFRRAMIEAAPLIQKVADFLTGLGKALHRNWNTIISVVGAMAKWGAALLVATRVVPMVVKVIRSLVAAYQWLNKSQIVTWALAGPKGWAMLAVAAGVATAAIVGMGLAFDSVQSSIKAMGEEGRSMMKNLSPQAEEMLNFADGIRKVRNIIEEERKALKNAGKSAGQIALEELTAQMEAAAAKGSDNVGLMADRIEELRGQLTVLDIDKRMATWKGEYEALKKSLEERLDLLGYARESERKQALHRAAKRQDELLLYDPNARKRELEHLDTLWREIEQREMLNRLLDEQSSIVKRLQEVKASSPQEFSIEEMKRAFLSQGGRWTDELEEVFKSLVVFSKQLTFEEAFKGAMETNNQLRQQIHLLEVGKDIAEREELEELSAKGFGLERMEEIRKLFEEREKLQKELQEKTDLKEEVDRIAEGIREYEERSLSPIQKFEKRVDRLRQLLNQGAIDWDTFSKAVKVAEEEELAEDMTRAPMDLGTFRTINTRLVDVAGLAMGAEMNPMVKKQDRTNEILEEVKQEIQRGNENRSEDLS